MATVIPHYQDGMRRGLISAARRRRPVSEIHLAGRLSKTLLHLGVQEGCGVAPYLTSSRDGPATFAYCHLSTGTKRPLMYSRESCRLPLPTRGAWYREVARLFQTGRGLTHVGH